MIITDLDKETSQTPKEDGSWSESAATAPPEPPVVNLWMSRSESRGDQDVWQEIANHLIAQVDSPPEPENQPSPMDRPPYLRLISGESEATSGEATQSVSASQYISELVQMVDTLGEDNACLENHRDQLESRLEELHDQARRLRLEQSQLVRELDREQTALRSLDREHERVRQERDLVVQVDESIVGVLREVRHAFLALSALVRGLRRERTLLVQELARSDSASLRAALADAEQERDALRRERERTRATVREARQTLRAARSALSRSSARQQAVTRQNDERGQLIEWAGHELERFEQEGDDYRRRLESLQAEVEAVAHSPRALLVRSRLRRAVENASSAVMDGHHE